jgi:DNA-binding transcriptional regulator YiaG
MESRDIIKKYEQVKLSQFKNAESRKVVIAARKSIARYCDVSVRTVDNWRTGKEPGKHIKMLLQRFAVENRLGDE